jgi:hypothetical protein
LDAHQHAYEATMNIVARHTILLVALILVGSLAITAAAQTTTTKPSLRVYVFTKVVTPGARIPSDQKARQDAVTDLTTSLANHRKVLVKTKSSEQADLSLEVLAREFRDSAELVNISPEFGSESIATAPAPTPGRAAFVSVRLTAVGHESVSSIVGKGPTWEYVGKGPTWEYAAEDVLKAVENWAKKNYDTVVGGKK